MNEFITKTIDNLIGLELYMKINNIKPDIIMKHVSKINDIIEEAKKELKNIEFENKVTLINNFNII